MSEHADKMIAQAQEQLVAVEQKRIELRRFINQVRAFDGQPPLYADESNEPSASGPIRSDQFYGRALATVVREILDMRKVANAGAATVAEIYAAMLEGGYDFAASSEENAKRTLRISLTKNAVFHKLPNGRYGLSEWYPAATKARKGKGDQPLDEADDELPTTEEIVNAPSTADTMGAIEEIELPLPATRKAK